MEKLSDNADFISAVVFLRRCSLIADFGAFLRRFLILY